MGNGTAHGTGLKRLGPWLPHVGAALILVACFAYGAMIYGSLPGIVPVHWDMDGPDAWEERSVGRVFLPLIVASGSTAVLAFISAAAPALSPKDPNASAWEAFRRQGMVRGTVAALGTVSLLIAGCVGYLTIQGWRAPAQVEIWPALLLSGAVAVAMIVVLTVSSRRARREAARKGVYPSEAELAEDAKWVAGILRNDPDEPHVLVPKRKGTGTGMTINVGNTRGRATVIIFVALVLVLPVGLGIVAGL